MMLEQPFALGGLQLEIDASIGIALSPEHGTDAETLLRRADVAMYVAKRASTGFSLYSAEHDQHSPTRLAMVGELRRAIEMNELSVYFQPKASMADGHISCTEALVRWQHPRHGLLGPDQFMPIAEQTGLIRPLARWVLDAALRQCNRWRQDGIDLAVAVNLSMRNLHDPEIVEMIRYQLTRWGIPRRPPGHRDHRKQPDGRRGARHGRAGAAARHGRRHLDRRLRHRLLVAGVPQATARGRAEDRQVVRRAHGRTTTTTRSSCARPSDWRTTSA